MKYRPVQYAQALLAACQDKNDAEQKKIVKRFIDLLVRHQAIGKIRAIYEAYEKLSLRAQGMHSVRLETADVVSEKLKAEIRVILGKNIDIEEVIDPDLMGGIKIIIDNEILIDASARAQIEGFFRK